MHGAVVDHEGTENTRVFRDVADHGERLKELDGLVGTTVRPEVGLIFDWDDRWALHFTQGPRQGPADGWNPWEKEYTRTAQEHYRPFWKLGIPVDVVESLVPFDRYRLLVAPMLFLLKPGVAERLEAFVRGGGTLVLTYLSGVVNETNLVFRGGLPGAGLRKVAGVWAEEVDSLHPGTAQRILAAPGNALGLTGEHTISEYAELIHAEGAEVLATFKTDFYAGRPALTVHSYGKGKVYYLAGRPSGDAFHDAFVGGLVRQLGLGRALDVTLPEGMTADLRTGRGRAYVIVHNVKPRPNLLDLGTRRLTDLESRAVLTGRVPFEPFESKVLLRD
jgi:beta-galactosidase